MGQLVAAFRRTDIKDEDVAHLALRLAESGERLSHIGGRPAADIPSTGGPSSLSTLLCPLMLVIGGAAVPKLGVPGRPAGGIDTLACIPRFNPYLTTSDVLRCLSTSHYAHFLAGERFAPLDALFFKYRKKIDAINVPCLAIASLLSKKLALGVNRVTLDVRVAPHTNFGSTWTQARDNAHQFIRVAQILGVTATCFLTDATIPYQPYMGRGESLVALARIFSDEQTEDLSSHIRLCIEMANLCLSTRVTPKPEEMREVFRANLEQQGATWEDFISKVQHVDSQPAAILTASSDGYFSVDLDGVRRVLVSRQQATESADEQFTDPCGVTLLNSCEKFVNKGDAVVRVRSAKGLDEVLTEVRRCMMYSAYPFKRRAPEKLVANHV
jgi:thymidine phosphorylase